MRNSNNLKSSLWGLIFVIAACMPLFTACEEDKPGQTTPEITVSVTDISVESALTLIIGQTETLSAEITPEDATNKSVVWSSSAEAIATVNNEGLVTAIAEGTASIIAAAADGGFTAICTVTVQAEAVPAESVTLNKTTLELVEGDSETLIAAVYPEDATDQSVTWSSSAPAIADVDGDGLVTAISEGPAIITVTTVDGKHTAACEVNVLSADISVESVALNKTTLELVEGDSETLIATVYPEDATDQSVTWSSSAPDIADVDDDGLVTAIAEGTAIITVTTADSEHTATCEVIVEADAHPFWGVISFRTPDVLELGNQIWSDVVLAERCRGVTAFAPGSGSNTVKACRENVNGSTTYGDIFSWQALSDELTEHALCPGDWRVPSKEDFNALDVAVNGERAKLPTGRYSDKVSAQAMVDQWGAEYSGYYYASQGKIYYQGTHAYYWTSTAASSATMGHGYFYTSSNGELAYVNTKTDAMAIRCVKDK